jgi:addiction module HigA family antidote
MRTKSGMPPVHPGEILADELEALGLTANALAGHLAVPTNRITAILKGQRGVTADTALRLARYLGTTPEFWLGLQQTFELRVAELESGREIEAQVHPRT